MIETLYSRTTGLRPRAQHVLVYRHALSRFFSPPIRGSVLMPSPQVERIEKT